MNYLNLHGERVAYREAGAGEALLLIHGMAGQSGSSSPHKSTPPRVFGQSADVGRIW
jgi:pimeloyl-ACP methyl ester carboxylesterase